jgi:hypothetical protein
MKRISAVGRIAGTAGVLVATAAVVMAAASARAGTVAAWNFDEGAGSTLHDATGAGNSGHLNGMTDANWIGGPVAGSGALGFNGSSQWIDFDTSAAINGLSGAMTIETWIRGGAAAGQELIFDKSHGFTDVTGWAIQSDGGDSVSFDLGVGSVFQALGFGHVLDGSWHQLVATFDGSSIRTYVDGAQIGSRSLGSGVTSNTNTRGLEMGRSWGGGYPQRYFDGAIGSSAILDTALGASAIGDQYSASVQSVPLPNALSAGIALLGAVALVRARRRRIAASGEI